MERERSGEGNQDYLHDGKQTTCIEYVRALLGPGRCECLLQPYHILKDSEAAGIVTPDAISEFLWVHQKDTLGRVIFIDPTSQVINFKSGKKKGFLATQLITCLKTVIKF